ncbi:MAG: dual specificity protein phosphatase family protein [Oceanospirillaceae bacterium]|nr:dual specificity protein phosphatase family protein [Oceanospirillaceae bacterium]
MFRAIDCYLDATIFLHSMPGRYEPWEQFVNQCQRLKIKHILCLTPLVEIAEKSLSYASAIEANQLPAKLHLSAVADFSIPAEIQNYTEHLALLAAHVRGGDNVLIHCAAGIGRTGSAAVCLLIALGLNTEEAIELVKNSGSGPETNEQLNFIKHFQLEDEE